MPEESALTPADYESLLAFRTGLRKFLRWSEKRAREAGLTPAQHQLLLAVKGHPGDQAPTVGDLADHLLLRHHSAVELIDRAEASGLVERWRDPDDGRVIRLRLTRDAEKRLTQLASAHLSELRRLAPILTYSIDGDSGPQRGLSLPWMTTSAAPARREARMRLSRRERRALRAIERRLRREDPALAAALSEPEWVVRKKGHPDYDEARRRRAAAAMAYRRGGSGRMGGI